MNKTLKHEIFTKYAVLKGCVNIKHRLLLLVFFYIGTMKKWKAWNVVSRSLQHSWEDIHVLSQNGAKMYWLPDIRVFPSPFWNFWALVYSQDKWV